VTKGTYGWIMPATSDLDATFDKVRAAGAEVVHEPIQRSYRVPRQRVPRSRRNLVRIQERR
jgi:hypothetical protein